MEICPLSAHLSSSHKTRVVRYLILTQIDVSQGSVLIVQERSLKIYSKSIIDKNVIWMHCNRLPIQDLDGLIVYHPQWLDWSA